MFHIRQCYGGLLAFVRQPRSPMATGLTHSLSVAALAQRITDEKDYADSDKEEVPLGDRASHYDCHPQVTENIIETRHSEAMIRRQGSQQLPCSPGSDILLFQEAHGEGLCTICDEVINGMCFTLDGCNVHFGCRTQLMEISARCSSI
jgi:hypothetical protein